MLQDLDATLAALLRAELGLPNVTISFAAPDEQFPPSSVALPAVVLFLYDVRENYELRTNQWEHERRPDGIVTRRRAPARVDCSYLITAWSSASAPNPTADEHRLLGAVMKVLLLHRTIPGAYLRGGLAGLEPPLRTRIMNQNQLQSIGEFWQAMGGKPKATLHYSVTLSVDVSEAEEIGREVTDKVISVSQMSTQMSTQG
jgi:Pvc16 N-terminal domain